VVNDHVVLISLVAVVIVLQVLLHIRLSGNAKALDKLERTGILIEDIHSSKMKQLKPATPRQRQRFLERALNSGSR
jgi:hypothetical protein